MTSSSPLLSSLSTTLIKALSGATGFGRITCTRRTERALIEGGLATREGEQVRITAAGREVQMEILAGLSGLRR